MICEYGTKMRQKLLENVFRFMNKEKEKLDYFFHHSWSQLWFLDICAMIPSCCLFWKKKSFRKMKYEEALREDCALLQQFREISIVFSRNWLEKLLQQSLHLTRTHERAAVELVLFWFWLSNFTAGGKKIQEKYGKSRKSGRKRA